ncbi:MAG: TonB-dependent receptor [Sphingomonas sp.]
MSRLSSSRLALSVGVAIGALSATPAFAQATPSPTPAEQVATPDGDILVTARRREETLLSVPVAITAFTADKLEKTGATDLTDIQNTTPNTTLKDARGTNSTLAAFIRGVGQQDPVPGFEAGIGIYLDDVYLNRPQAAVLDVYDVERIEVLRGPQGTLYGRNTIGGAVKYVTKRLPDHFEANLKATYGSYNQADGIISLATPIGAGFKIGVSGARLTRDGFGRNLNLNIDNYNKDIWAGRATVEFESPDQRMSIRVTADYTHDKSNARNGHRMFAGLLTGSPVLSNVYDTNSGLNSPKEDIWAGGVSMVAEGQLSDHVSIKSVSAFRKDRSYTPIDFDSTPSVDVDVPAIYKNEQTSQEFQLSYKSDKLNGIVGFYYLGAKAQTGFDVLLYTTGGAILPQLDAYTRGDVRTETESVYGDFTYDFTRQFSLSLGGRYTWDERNSTIFKQNYLGGPTSEFGGNPVAFGAPATDFNGVANFRRFTPRASLAFKPDADQLFYASYSEGFKGGGFDPRGSGTSAPISNPAAGRTYQDIYNYLAFKPESVNSYEIGWKGAAFDRRLTWALDGFYADYTDVQIPGATGCVSGGVQTFCGATTNAGKAWIKGLELETNAVLARGFAGPGSNVTFTGALGYIEPKFKRFIGLTGNFVGATQADIADVSVFQNTPKWTVSGTLGANLPMGDNNLNAQTTVSYRSETHQFNTASALLDQPGYTLLDAHLTYSFGHGRYSIGVHGKNLTNVHYKTGGYQYLYAKADGTFTDAFGKPVPAGTYVPNLGKEGIGTVFYGNPRQVFGTITAKF